jgi:hypothetical protein
MRLLRLAAVAGACLLFLAGVASADPGKAPGATTQTYVCGGVPITLVTLPNNSSAAFTATTSVGIAVGVTVTDTFTGQTLFSDLTPGFEHNGLQTTTCRITSGATQIDVTAFFTPATK